MSYASFRSTVLTRFLDGFLTVRPSFPATNIVFDRSGDLPPEGQTWIQVIYADLEGDFAAIGKIVTQTALITVDIFVPEGVDRLLVEQLAYDVHYTFQWLIVPDSGRKRRLSKRDFPSSLGGYAHARVSVDLVYEVKEDA